MDLQSVQSPDHKSCSLCACSVLGEPEHFELCSLPQRCCSIGGQVCTGGGRPCALCWLLHQIFDSTFLELRGFCVKIQLKETGCSLDTPEFLRWCHSCTYHLSIGMAEKESSSCKRKIIERLVLQTRPKLPLLLAGSALYLC